VDKFIAFGDYLMRELINGYFLEGHTREIDEAKYSAIAQSIAKELISQYPHLTLSNLEICIPMARKMYKKVNYSTIVDTLKHETYQQALMEVNRKNNPAELIGRSSEPPPSYLWKTINLKFHATHQGLKNEDIPTIVAQCDRIEQEALQNGYTLEQEYKGEV
jgi:hypothetical protein